MRHHSRRVRDLTGTVFGHYEVKQRLGMGGMAVVYLAVQQPLGREVALKALRPTLAEDGEFIGRFQVEAKTLARLEHPNILPIYDFDTIDGVTFLTMPLARGGSLERMIRRGGPMEPVVAWRYMRDVGGALAYAHAAGIIHRDLKPANVLLDTEGRPLLADFGLARTSREPMHLTSAGSTVGTPGYMAPEQVLGHDVDQRADLYSYAVMLFEMLTGRRPFNGSTPMEIAIATVQAPIPSAAELNPELPDELDAVFAKSLAKLPSQRFQSMTELMAALGRLPQRRSTPRKTSPPRPGTRPPGSGPAQPATPLPTGPPTGAIVVALELQGIKRPDAKNGPCLNSHFATVLGAAREVTGASWPDVASAASMPKFINKQPPTDELLQTPAEAYSRLNEAFERVFGSTSTDKIRHWGSLSMDRYLRLHAHRLEQQTIKLLPGQTRKLEAVLKSFTRSMDEVRGEHLHAWKQVDDEQFWLVHFSNLFALGRRKADKACHFWTASLDSVLRWAGLANDWEAGEIECGCVTGTFDCVFSLQAKQGKRHQ